MSNKVKVETILRDHLDKICSDLRNESGYCKVIHFFIEARANFPLNVVPESYTRCVGLIYILNRRE